MRKPGRGVALIPTHAIEAELAADSVPSSGAIYFAWPRDARPSPALDAFRDWLVDAPAGYRDD